MFSGFGRRLTPVVDVMLEPGGEICERVSCVIPTRNRKLLLQRAVRSVLGQNVGPIEIVVVDDGSTDGTTRWLQRHHPSIRVVPSAGLGPGPARNLGVEAATGEVVMFLDSDDEWLPEHVGSLLAMIHAGFDVGYGVTQTVDEIDGKTFLIPDGGVGPNGDCFHDLLRWCFMVPSAVVVRKQIHGSVGGFGPGSLGEDWAYFLRLAAKTVIGFTSDLITRRYLHAGSQCNLVQGGKEKVLRALDGVIEVLEETPGNWNQQLDRINAMKEMAAKEGETWRSVQDWYLTLKKRNFLESRAWIV